MRKLKQFKPLVDVSDIEPGPAGRKAKPGEPEALIYKWVMDDLRNIGAEPDSKCREWPFQTDRDGYGRVNGFGTQYVHRLLLLIHTGEPPTGICSVTGKLTVKGEAAHGACHNPRCCNVAHLSWKTTAENAADKLRDGTDARGEKHGSAVLSAPEVLEIRELYAAGGVTQRALAKQFGIGFSQVSDIVRRESWSHLPEQGAA